MDQKGSNKNKKKSKGHSGKEEMETCSNNKKEDKTMVKSYRSYSSSKGTLGNVESSIGIANFRAASISSLASRYNLNIGRFTATRKCSSVSSNKGIGNKNNDCINQYGDYLYDCVMIYLFCPLHKKLALSEIVPRGLFLPFCPIKIGESWLSAALRLIHKTLKGPKNSEKPIFKEPTIIDILRIQLPIYFEYITRVIYSVKLTNDACHSFNLCKDNSMIAWFPINEINISNVYNNNYLGPEPAFFQSSLNLCCREITILDVLFYLYNPDKNCKASKLIQKTGYEEKDLLKLYSNFLQHCYPSEFMTQYSFKSFLSKWEFVLPNEEKVFHSFSSNKGNNYYLNFNQFLCGLATIDNSINKKNRNESLSKQDQKVYVHCETSPLSYIRTHQCYPVIQLKQVLTSEMNKNAVLAKIQRSKELCINCRSKNYTLSVHMVKMSSEGRIYDPVVNKQSDVERMIKQKKTLSDHFFTQSFICNQIIDMIRAYAIKTNVIQPDSEIISTTGAQKNTPNWDIRSEHFIEKIIKICNEAKSLFQNCSRVIKVTSPCYIIGDIHGNLRDLLIYERTIWKLGPYFTPTNYLFLGDYVDRGDFSVECILYLLCMKLLVPDRIFMLRGNHECRSLQKEFTFLHECKEKFGTRGDEMWEIFNDVFDVMPLCAIIDESIFCAHGGIPSCAQKIEQIMSVKSPLKDPENDSDIALEILWNDPVTNQEFQDLTKNLTELTNNHVESSTKISVNKRKRILANGFMPNTKRGTACYFNEDALNNFLNINNLSHVIRAHEVIPSGFQYHMGGRCITVFSCSNYCGGINEAAVVFVHDSKIRIIKVDTKQQ